MKDTMLEGLETETEGGRSPTGVSVSPAPAIDPEVSAAKPRRRRFTAAEKRRILEAADGCKAHGELGALLRREGIYSSHVASWRKQRDQNALAPAKRGRRPDDTETKAAKALAEEVKKLRKEKGKLERKLKRAELLIDIQKKVSEILGIPLKSLEDDESDS